jgi:hypothetical protein
VYDSAPVWCIFDNTALGAATGDALIVTDQLKKGRSGFHLFHSQDFKQELDAVSLILIEYANDLAFLNFLRAHGFIEVGTTTYNGFAIVRMEKTLVG